MDFGNLAYRPASFRAPAVKNSIKRPAEMPSEPSSRATVESSTTTLAFRPATNQNSGPRKAISHPATSNPRTSVSRKSSSKSASVISVGIEKRSTSMKEQERRAKDLARGMQKALKVTRTPSEQILDKLCRFGKLTNEGINLLDKILWDFEIGYADFGPSWDRSIWGSAADAFCLCAMPEVIAWRRSLGHAVSRSDEKPSIAILMRAYLESFYEPFAEKREAEYSKRGESVYKIERQVAVMKAKFAHRAQEDFFEALWEHFLEQKWRC